MLERTICQKMNPLSPKNRLYPEIKSSWLVIIFPKQHLFPLPVGKGHHILPKFPNFWVKKWWQRTLCCLTLSLGESGKYYCSQRVLSCSCCDGRCGPNNGCSCAACQKLDEDEKRDSVKQPLPSVSYMESWTWGTQPGKQENNWITLRQLFFRHCGKI